LLSNAIGDLVLIGGSLILSLPAPIGAIQILFINFFTDSFPAVAYAFETGEELQGREMKSNKILDTSLRHIVIIGSIGTSFIIFGAYVLLLHFEWTLPEARTIAFASLGFSTLFIALFLRRLDKPFWNIPWDNKYMSIGLAIGSAMMLGAVYIPVLQPAFESVSLSPTNLLLTLGISFVAALPVELAKWIDKKRKKA
jgi:Ca2+-transporting ATPase